MLFRSAQLMESIARNSAHFMPEYPHPTAPHTGRRTLWRPSIKFLSDIRRPVTALCSSPNPDGDPAAAQGEAETTTNASWRRYLGKAMWTLRPTRADSLWLTPTCAAMLTCRYVRQLTRGSRSRGIRLYLPVRHGRSRVVVSEERATRPQNSTGIDFPEGVVLSREWVPQTLYSFVCDLDPQDQLVRAA